MATNHRQPVTEAEVAETTKEEVKSAPAKKPAKQPKVESVYTAAELAAAYKTFGTSYEIVSTALKIAKKDRATVEEAKQIIETFKNKEVK